MKGLGTGGGYGGGYGTKVIWKGAKACVKRGGGRADMVKDPWLVIGMRLLSHLTPNIV